MRRKDLLLLASASLAVVCVAPLRAGAEVRLSGSLDSVVLQANGATMPEIVAALQSTFHVRIELVGSTPRRFTGAYAGPLRRVLARLLDGGDYVISPASDGVKVVILPPNGAKPGLAPGVRVAVDTAEGNGSVQGWSPGQGSPRTAAPAPPTRLAAAAAAPARASGGDDGEGNTIQGWVPTSPPAPPTRLAAAAAAPATAPAGGADEGSEVQGWVPAPAPAAERPNPPPPSQARSVPTAAAAAREPDEGSSVQGWVPTQNPFRAAQAAPAEAKPAPKPDTPAAKGDDPPANLGVQGWSGWSGPLLGGSRASRVPAMGGLGGPMIPPPGLSQDD